METNALPTIAAMFSKTFELRLRMFEHRGCIEQEKEHHRRDGSAKHDHDYHYDSDSTSPSKYLKELSTSQDHRDKMRQVCKYEGPPIVCIKNDQRSKQRPPK